MAEEGTFELITNTLITEANIGIEAHFLFKLNKTRAEHEALKLIQSIVALDAQHKIFIIAPNGPDQSVKEELVGAKIITTRTYPKFFWSNVVLLMVSLRLKLDLLHCTSVFPPIYSPFPVVLSYFSMKTPFLLQKTFLHVFFRKVKLKMRKFYLNKAKGIITPSKFLKKDIKAKYGIKGKKIQIVYQTGLTQNRISLNEFSYLKFKSYFPKAYVLYYHFEKNEVNLFRALTGYLKYRRKDPKGYPLVIANASKSHVQEILVQLDGEEFIHEIIIIEEVFSSEYKNLYRQALLFLYPASKKDSVIPVIDALSLGTPVLTSPVGAFTEILKEGTGFVDPDNPEEIGDSLEKILNHPEVYEQLLESGIARSKKFNSFKSALNTVWTYDKVLLKMLEKNEEGSEKSPAIK